MCIGIAWEFCSNVYSDPTGLAWGLIFQSICSKGPGDGNAAADHISRSKAIKSY